ncbi:MAG: trypsin-like peptidase domain-containing protein [Actinomycetota bacterium]|nr:trypsin-like peptidase domain-containing protein [Actinomycetota bacterium]
MNKTPRLIIALLTVAALVSGACDFQIRSRDAREPDAQTQEFEPLPEVTFAQSDEDPPSSTVADTIEGVLPSVVNVRVTSLRQDILGGVEEGRGQGSGVIIDRRGVIVTNNHVVQQATEVTVVLHDGRRLDGTVVDTRTSPDLAVIRVDADDLTPIEFGRSEALRLGDEVIALGFPLGLTGGPTVTQGIVSALDRTIEVGGTTAEDVVELEGLIQTDAAINPGNSGGPLVDLNGRLIGINTAAAGAAAAENVGFAISIDDAIPVIEEILTTPPERRPWMGVLLADVDEETLAELDADLPSGLEGALITHVISESPAEQAGLEAGEVVTEVQGDEVAGAQALIDRVAEFEPGETVEFEVVSESGTRTVELDLAVRPGGF